MTLDPITGSGLDFAREVERAYASLLASRKSESHAEPGLGGWLLYAGELNAPGRALLVAGNIAGVASLAAIADEFAQKQAIRDGVADFLVTSLDEALRILKNEIRKREAVAVCVAAEPRTVENEMLERGVLPDLLPPTSGFSQCRHRLVSADPAPGSVLLCWSVATTPTRWLPKLDLIAFDCLSPETSFDTQAARRWLRLAPRYLGRLANSFRILRCSLDVADAFSSEVQAAIKKGEIGVPVRIAIEGKDDSVFDPNVTPENSPSSQAQPKEGHAGANRSLPHQSGAAQSDPES